MNIDLHIESLTLHGLGFGAKDEIRAALERSLTELLSASGPAGLAGQRSLVASVDAGSMEIGHSATPQEIGMQLAQMVYGGIKAWTSH